MNVEIAQKAYADFAQGNIPAILEALDENVEWITPGDRDISGTRRGKAEVAEFFSLVGKTWQFDAFEPKQFIAAGDQVVVIGSYSARSTETGRAASSDWVMLWNFSGGKVTRFQEFTDTQVMNAALPAATSATA